jgi:hypothetical protein
MIDLNRDRNTREKRRTMKYRHLAAVVSIVGVIALGCASAPPEDVQPTPVIVPTAIPAPAAVATPVPQSPGAAPQTQATPAAAAGVPAASGATVGEADVKRMAEAWAAATSYRMTLEGSQEGETFEMVYELVRPDRERTRISSEGQNIEFIRIGNDQYTNLTGEWVKTAAEPGSAGVGVNPAEIVQGFNESLAGGDRVTRGNILTVNGVQCQEWVISAVEADDSGTMCIGVQDNLPRRFQAADGSVTMTFTDWNSPIRIDPPI